MQFVEIIMVLLLHYVATMFNKPISTHQPKQPTDTAINAWVYSCVFGFAGILFYDIGPVLGFMLMTFIFEFILTIVATHYYSKLYNKVSFRFPFPGFFVYIYGVTLLQLINLFTLFIFFIK